MRSICLNSVRMNQTVKDTAHDNNDLIGDKSHTSHQTVNEQQMQHLLMQHWQMSLAA